MIRYTVVPFQMPLVPHRIVPSSKPVGQVYSRCKLRSHLTPWPIEIKIGKKTQFKSKIKNPIEGVSTFV